MSRSRSARSAGDAGSVMAGPACSPGVAFREPTGKRMGFATGWVSGGRKRRDVLTAHCASPNRLLPPTPLVFVNVRFRWDFLVATRVGSNRVVIEGLLDLGIPADRY